MQTYQITNTTSGTIGFYRALDREHALDQMAKQAGYRSYAECCEITEDGDDLEVAEVTAINLGGCPRCNESVYHFDDGDMVCSECGLVHGEDPDDLDC